MFKKYVVFESGGVGIAYSVQRLSTGWRVREANPGGGEFFRTVQPDSEAHPAFYTMCTGSFQEVKQPGPI
jgi:hypothetical protein